MPHAHVVTSTTHKTLGGPRGGIILTNDEALAKKINSAVFPGQQGGPSSTSSRPRRWRSSSPPSRSSASASSARSPARKSWPTGCCRPMPAPGISVVSGGTDVHLVLVDLRASELDGKQAEDRLHGSESR